MRFWKNLEIHRVKNSGAVARLARQGTMCGQASESDEDGERLASAGSQSALGPVSTPY